MDSDSSLTYLDSSFWSDTSHITHKKCDLSLRQQDITEASLAGFEDPFGSLFYDTFDSPSADLDRLETEILRETFDTTVKEWSSSQLMTNASDYAGSPAQLGVGTEEALHVGVLSPGGGRDCVPCTHQPFGDTNLAPGYGDINVNVDRSRPSNLARTIPTEAEATYAARNATNVPINLLAYSGMSSNYSRPRADEPNKFEDRLDFNACNIYIGYETISAPQAFYPDEHVGRTTTSSLPSFKTSPSSSAALQSTNQQPGFPWTTMSEASANSPSRYMSGYGGLDDCSFGSCQGEEDSFGAFHDPCSGGMSFESSVSPSTRWISNPVSPATRPISEAESSTPKVWYADPVATTNGLYEGISADALNSFDDDGWEAWYNSVSHSSASGAPWYGDHGQQLDGLGLQLMEERRDRNDSPAWVFIHPQLLADAN